jgi:hypothetical protein
MFTVTNVKSNKAKGAYAVLATSKAYFTIFLENISFDTVADQPEFETKALIPQVSFCVVFMLMVGRISYGKQLLYSLFLEASSERLNNPKGQFGSLYGSNPRSHQRVKARCLIAASNPMVLRCPTRDNESRITAQTPGQVPP